MSIIRSFAIFLLFFVLILITASCSSEPDRLFLLLPPAETGIDFENRVENTPEFNIQNYLYFYDGGGVAAGDLNNNGLPDLIFISNTGSHKVYKNLGDFRFEDITEQTGIHGEMGSWSTGVAMADVNGSGYLDIYISRVNYLNKSGANQLWINNGDGTFSERAADFGLDFEGYSTQAAFFDYNNNGRLDLFLLNHSFHSEDTYGDAEVLRTREHPRAGDRLFRNDGERFTDVTIEAGIISSALGYGLGLAISDITQNGYPDIYVGNDFHEDDYFYINNGDGTFTESLYRIFGHTSNSSMGNDIADLTNNGRPDVFSLDMMAEDHDTFMRSGGPDPMIVYNAKRGFNFGEKNNRNTLQINQGFSPEGLPLFSETAFATGTARTEWSWAALMADFTNSGFADIFVTNGMPLRPNDQDYVRALQGVRQNYSGEELRQKEYELIETMPVAHVHNYMYRNDGNLQFHDVTHEWGFSAPTFSSGAVYVDLNNNGRLDLVVNNTNEQAHIYKNRFMPSDEGEREGSYLMVKLNGSEFNTTGIGTKLILYHDDKTFYREQMPVRGFQSSVDHRVHFGLGNIEVADSLLVIWPDHSWQTMAEVETNTLLEISHKDAEGRFDYSRLHNNPSDPFMENLSDRLPDHRHRENTHDDFGREPLMPYKLSTQGPALDVADITGNGLDDYYIGGSRGNAGKLFLQQSDGTFQESEQPDFTDDRDSEDVDAIFFDATGNGDMDLLVVSGGNEHSGQAVELLDRLYINMGDGTFSRSLNSLPDIAVNGSSVTAADFNGNGHIDLFIGGHIMPWRYGIGPRSFLLENNGNGVFEDVTEEKAPVLETIGNVTAASWFDEPGSDYPSLVVAGEWMGIHIFRNRGGELVQETEEAGISGLRGLWQSLHVTDLTGNGYPDVVAGNFGTNSRIEASEDAPLTLFVSDFEGTGQTAPLIAYEVDGVLKPFEQLDEVIAQIPSLTNRIRSYEEYAASSIYDLFDREKLDEALRKEITELRSVVLLNRGDGGFDVAPMPFEAQWSPVMDILSGDFNGNGSVDLLLTGNLYDVKPSMGGRQDASHGLFLSGNGDGSFEPVRFSQSGFLVEGQGRAVRTFRHADGSSVLVARNNDFPLLFRLNSSED